MDGVLYYVTIPPDPPGSENLMEDDECPAGGDHEAEIEDLSFSGNFWGQPVLEKRESASCRKCGAALAISTTDGPDRYDD